FSRDWSSDVCSSDLIITTTKSSKGNNMKINCTFELPEDFQQVCDIFGYQPEQVLQRFMEEVSFPEFFSDPDNDHRWATLFFLYRSEERRVGKECKYQ